MSVIYTPNITSWENGQETNRRTIWQVFDKITPVQAYRVGSQLYLTPKAAAKKMAWSMILNKYVNIKGNEHLEDVRKILDLECDCPADHERGDYGQVIQFKHEACQIHNRQNGYFKRLHARLVRILLAMYAASVAAKGESA